MSVNAKAGILGRGIRVRRQHDRGLSRRLLLTAGGKDMAGIFESHAYNVQRVMH